MTPLDFSNLQEISTHLNQDSDELTKTLGEINSRLNELNLGVEVWLRNPMVSEPANPENWGITQEDTPGECCHFSYLGYGKFLKWGLLVKATTEFRDRGSSPWQVLQTQTRFLLESPRAERIKAVDQIPELLEKLHAEAAKVRQAVEKARLLAKNL